MRGNWLQWRVLWATAPEEKSKAMGHFNEKAYPKLVASEKLVGKLAETAPERTLEKCRHGLNLRRSAWTPTLVLVVITLLALLAVFALRELLTGTQAF